MNPKVIRIVGWCLTSIYEALVYFVSFFPPILVLYHFRALPIPVLCGLALAGYAFAGWVFLLLLVLTKRYLIGSLPTGNIAVSSKDGQRWFLAVFLMAMVNYSPFRSLLIGLSPLGPMFFRGMGARMPDSTFMGQDTKLRDPWFLEMGEHVSTGGEVLILGHVGHNQDLFLGKVIVGDDVVIGSRSIIFPDVHIGSHARVGAGAVVIRGTRIPDGEVWAGVPARKLERSKRQRHADPAG